MWADAKRDGRRAEIRWRHLLNAAELSLADPTAGVPCNNAANIGDAILRHKVNFACGKIPSWGKSPENVYTSAGARRPNIVQSLVGLQ